MSLFFSTFQPYAFRLEGKIESGAASGLMF
jgi:hypothetical protein